MWTSYKLYATVTADTDGAASMDVRADGTLKGCLMSLYVDGADALNDGAEMELSFLSSSGFVTNDTTGSFAGCATIQNFLTSGGGAEGVNVFVPLDIAVNSGERIFMHINELGAPADVIAKAWLYIEERGSGTRPRIARR